MKRTIALILALVLCFGLCACSGTMFVERKLQGEWDSALGVYTFTDGKFTLENLVTTVEGTYEVHEDIIELDFDLALDLGLDADLNYTYEDGNLEIDGLTKRD